MTKKRTKMIYIDDELIEWFEKKYPKRSFSPTINELLKNYLYIDIDDKTEDLSKEIRKTDIKINDLAAKKKLLQIKLEEIENKKAQEMEELKQLDEERKQKLLSCVSCGGITHEANRVKLRDRFMHKSCFNSADAATLNKIIQKIENNEI